MPARDSRTLPAEDRDPALAAADAPASRARMRPAFAALGLVGGAMVCLPLVQLLQYQAEEIEWARTQRAALDPAADAVAVQRSLMAHGTSAGAVLRGQVQQEPQRQARQAEVDHHVLALSRSLSEGHWASAWDEARQLQQDWQVLADQVAQRQISAALSDEGHRLRVEQVLQVMDLLVLASAPASGWLAQASPVPAAALTLPRQTWQWAALTQHPDNSIRQAAQRALQHQLQALRRAASPATADPASAAAWPASSTLAGAIERAALRTERWLALHPAQAGSDGAVEGAGWLGQNEQVTARQTALQALFEVQVAASQQGMQTLDQQITRLQWQRASSLAALLALAGLSCWLLLGLYRQALPARPPVRPSPAARFAQDEWEHTRPLTTRLGQGDLSPQPPESASEARRVLQRLRQGPPAEPGAGVNPRDAQPSLPPKF